MKYLLVSEVVIRFNRSRQAVTAALNKGSVSGIKKGWQWFVDENSAEKFFKGARSINHHKSALSAKRINSPSSDKL